MRSCKTLLKDFMLTSEGLENIRLLHHCWEQWPCLEAPAGQCFSSIYTKSVYYDQKYKSQEAKISEIFQKSLTKYDKLVDEVES